jgi:hypothetical protein
MTDVVVSDVDTSATSQEPLTTHYLASLDDAVEHLRAAALLGFGVRLSSYLVPASDESFSERWELEVLAESPVEPDSTVDDQ